MIIFKNNHNIFMVLISWDIHQCIMIGDSCGETCRNNSVPGLFINDVNTRQFWRQFWRQCLPTIVADKCCRQMLPTIFDDNCCQQLLTTIFMTIFDDLKYLRHWLQPGFITIFVTWQLILTLDSIRNSCDVFIGEHFAFFIGGTLCFGKCRVVCELQVAVTLWLLWVHRSAQ